MDKIWLTIERDGKAILSVVKEYDYITYEYMISYSSRRDPGDPVQVDEDRLDIRMERRRREVVKMEDPSGN